MNNSVDIPLISDHAQLPSYARPGDAGADLRSTNSLVLHPGERALVSTGIRIALPEGYLGFVVPRSGLAVRHGISIVNSPGTIDAGYRGEIKVPLINLDPHASFTVNVGDRIAQLIIMPVSQASFIRVDTLPDSARGESGFGSTGV